MKQQINYPECSKYNFFITFEGLDASYKLTNAKLIYDYLKDDFKKYIDTKDLQIKIASFPRYQSQSSYYIKKYLNGNYVDKPNEVGLQSTAYLNFVANIFLMDMYDWYESIKQKRFFAKPSIIILDRYWYSMLYYLTKEIKITIEQYHMTDPLSFIEKSQQSIYKLAHDQLKLPETDILINLHNNSIGDISAKIKQRGEKKDIYENDKNYLGFVRNVFNSTDFTPYVNSKYSSVVDIDVQNKDKEFIKEELIEKIKPTLRRYKQIVARYKKR